jgi:hypothetical protein
MLQHGRSNGLHLSCCLLFSLTLRELLSCSLPPSLRLSFSVCLAKKKQKEKTADTQHKKQNNTTIQEKRLPKKEEER